MSHDATARTPGTRGRGAPHDDDALFELLRYSHIFASLVREVLEAKYLEEVSRDSLTLSQLHLLKLVSLNGQHQVGEVADFLGVSAPAASKNIDKLERLGLLTRNRSKGDRRATLLSCSARGRRLVEEYETLKTDRLAPVLARFSREELGQLSRLLEKFSLLLIQNEDGNGGVCLRCSAYYDADCPVSRLRDGCPYQKALRSHSDTASPLEA